METSLPVIVSRILSYSVISLGLIMKIPQVWQTYSTKKTIGVSTKSLWLDMISNLIPISYAYYYSHHITTYLDLIIIMIQGGVILMLVLHYNNDFNSENIIYIMLFLSYTVVSCLSFIPPTLLYILMILSIPITVSGKLLQIYAIYSSQTSANVSAVTWSIASYNCWARVYTLLIEVNDLVVVLNYLLTAILNIIVLFQCLYYRTTNKKE